MEPDEVFRTAIQSMIPRGGPQTIEDIGNLTVFLTTDKDWEITGQVINVDDGLGFN